ncbi:FMN-dependent NADH-azoreductase [Chitinophaga agrisoli]|uniref:FMN dependent NADH:quinone oxidoreductase n=1 Tax=Chitinophaga agrisoli TaxID=2607653 RepID=A0A5B2VMW1_9BACT|nr:NAD(P)H-dependent oxidoreductase [Chitinophaga agrisoli]KAA2240345.1 FMN-dependent NADH-azoreductase [Chitinophaga agrisoli]
MKNALHITSSARGDQSHSTRLSAAVVRKLIGKNEISTLVERDLTKNPPPFFDQAMIGVFYKHPATIDEEERQLLAYADTIFQEVSNADIIVIATPIHNFGISAPLKAWIDQLIRFGVTYDYNSEGVRTGRLNHKKIYLAIASGGSLTEWPNSYEFIESYTKAVFNSYVGMTDICTFRVEGTAANNFTVDYEQIIQGL